MEQGPYWESRARAGVMSCSRRKQRILLPGTATVNTNTVTRASRAASRLQRWAAGQKAR